MSYEGDKAMCNESQWPEDEADWPQTASVVQGGAVPVKAKNQIIPKGSMCQGCSKLKQDCSHLNFANMPKIKKYPDGVVAVKCTAFQAKTKDEAE